MTAVRLGRYTVGESTDTSEESVDLRGPMFCEEHPQTIWPHDDCAGPGIWHTNGTLRQFGITPRAEVERLQAENRLMQAQLLHYDAWFGDDCPCDDKPCPLAAGGAS